MHQISVCAADAAAAIVSVTVTMRLKTLKDIGRREFINVWNMLFVWVSILIYSYIYIQYMKFVSFPFVLVLVRFFVKHKINPAAAFRLCLCDLFSSVYMESIHSLPPYSIVFTIHVLCLSTFTADVDIPTYTHTEQHQQQPHHGKKVNDLQNPFVVSNWDIYRWACLYVFLCQRQSRYRDDARCIISSLFFSRYFNSI